MELNFSKTIHMTPYIRTIVFLQILFRSNTISRQFGTSEELAPMRVAQ